MNQDERDLIRWSWSLRDRNKSEDENITRIANAFSISKVLVREIIK